ncbi:MAG: YqeG family HAD IIIA-type phosphatase [Fimbriimonadaceae bacterium]|nr:YqeG family HAD IIIA-type phosphatase [Fimbriimonadaceae bacterium]
MNTWQNAEFDRDRVPPSLRRFTPVSSVDSLDQVELLRLWDQGKRLILVDVDHTLLQWESNAPSPAVIAWIAQARQIGFDLCLISNTRRIDRLRRISSEVGIETVRGRIKPSRAMYRLALIKFKRSPEETVMVGDQLLTDVWGANRSGIEAIWVQRMEGKEFAGTKINRVIERSLQSRLYRYLSEPQPRDAEPSSTLQKQVVRFIIVGGTSFLIDTVIKMALTRWTPFAASLGAGLLESGFASFYAQTALNAASPIVATIAWMIATVNSLIFNRSWTFEAVGKDSRIRQIQRFYLITIVGGALNIALYSTVFALTNKIEIAQIVGAGLAAVWNFLGQRLFAFRARS